MKYRTDSDDLNTDGSPFDKLGKQVTGVASDLVNFKATNSRIVGDLERLESRMDNLQRVVKDDWNDRANSNTGRAASSLRELGDFTKQVIDLELHHKAADDMLIMTDARGGYLVPETVQRDVDALVRPYGSLLSLCNYTTRPYGQTHAFPAFSTAPLASWQMTEGGALTEMDIQLTALERKSFALGGWVDASYQLFHNPDANFSDVFSREMMAAIRQAAETALVAGDAGVDAPYDGLLELSGTNDLTDVATVTQANVSTFIAEAVEAVPGLWDTGVLVVNETVAETLAQNASTAAYTGRVTYDAGSRGLRFGRWPIVVTPAVGNDHILMLDPSLIHVVNSGYSVLVDESSGIKNLMVTLGLAGWFGYGVAIPSSVCKADITALS